MAMLANVAASRGRFVEEKTLAALQQPLRSTGTLEYRRPDHLAKVTTSPPTERLVVDGNRLSITDGDAAARSLDLSEQPEIRTLVDTVRGLLAGDLATLSRLYTLRLEGSVELWRLTMQPADARLARYVRVVQVDGEGADVRAIRTEQSNGDVDLLTIDPIR